MRHEASSRAGVKSLTLLYLQMFERVLLEPGSSFVCERICCVYVIAGYSFSVGRSDTLLRLFPYLTGNYSSFLVGRSCAPVRRLSVKFHPVVVGNSPGCSGEFTRL